MTTKFITRLIFPAIVAALAPISRCPGESADSVRSESRMIKIGVVTDLTGHGASYGVQTKIGAELAAEDLRSEGANVEIMVEDTALKPAQALSATQKLLHQDSVNAVLSNFTSVSTAISPLMRNAKRLLVYLAAARSIVDSNPYALKSYSDYEDGCEAVARQFRKEGITRIGILRAEAEFGELCARGVRKVYSDPIEISYTTGESVRTQTLLLKTKGAQAIVNGCYEGDLLNTLQAAKDIGYAVRLATGEDNLTAAVRLKYGSSLEGALTWGVLAPPNALIDRANARVPHPLPGHENVGLAYLHTKQMYRALVACPASDIACVMNKMESAAPEPEFGFQSWERRIAQLTTPVKRFENGALEDVSLAPR
ncbi:MAG: ABC transporter substrate-binding protein [Deltaproteobacteria bacterium]|nr:ABC transporter substrate-binding protein [Deltaproteobacteria bacterium]